MIRVRHHSFLSSFSAASWRLLHSLPMHTPFLAAEDYPVVQASSSKNAASFKVALDYPKPGAAYYLRVYKDAARTQPDGGEQRISFTSGAGTAAAPFTFTWSYKAAGTPATQRWFVVEVDADGEGPGKRVASSMVGPVLLGEQVDAQPCRAWLNCTRCTSFRAMAVVAIRRWIKRRRHCQPWC